MYALRNLADLASDTWFRSKNARGQRVCLDFHGLRVRPTHYTIKTDSLKSWVVESSPEAVGWCGPSTWTQIDRKTNNTDFKNDWVASFAVSNSAECRFIRLTQTDKNHFGGDFLVIYAIEVFGALLE
jgi:hypothetical protein